MKHIILDTDPGVDDALAILLAFNSPEISVKAVTTVAGNVSHNQGHLNAKKLLNFLKKGNIPVSKGAEKPIMRITKHAERIHGKKGLGLANLPAPSIKTSSFNAVEIILKKTEEFGKKLTLLAIGPLTNIASAILADPELPKKVGGLVIMGGAYNLNPYGYGNINSVAEFNIWFDPEAAQIVFNSGIPLTCAGLDITTIPENRLSSTLFEEIKKKNTKKSRLVVNLCQNIVERFNGISLHDPMALAYVIDPSMFKTQRFRVNIETRGEITRGMTIIDRDYNTILGKKANTEIIVEVEAERFHSLIIDRIT